MDTLKDFLQGPLFIVLVVIIQVLIAVAGSLIINFLSQLNKKSSIELDDKIMGQIENLIDSIVISANQTVVEKYKEHSKNNKLSDQEATIIYNTVRDTVYSFLTDEQRDFLKYKFISINDGLQILIEKSVANNKTTFSNENTFDDFEFDTSVYDDMLNKEYSDEELNNIANELNIDIPIESTDESTESSVTCEPSDEESTEEHTNEE